MAAAIIKLHYCGEKVSNEKITLVRHLVTFILQMFQHVYANVRGKRAKNHFAHTAAHVQVLKLFFCPLAKKLDKIYWEERSFFQI